MSRVRWGLFGGTFDPIHNGHLALLDCLYAATGVEKVVLMPTACPPHKLRGYMAPADDRLSMCRLAVADRPWVAVSDRELRRGGASFTAETLEGLQAAYSQVDWVLFVGADMFLTLDTWFRAPDILRMAEVATVPRDEYGRATLWAYADRLRAAGGRCVVASMPPVDISSTELRHRLATGASLAGFVPPPVAAYVAQHHLYTGEEPLMPTDEQIVEILRHRLTPARLNHSLEVAKEAERLARRWGADSAKAKTAGLLHDILKNTDSAEQLKILEEFGILLTDVERAGEKLYHAMSGAAFIEHILGVSDRDLLNAVRYHTTARAGMSLLEQVLYLADFTSADRDYPDVEIMRQKTDESREAAMMYALEYSLRDLLEQHRAIHPDTVAAYNEWCLKTQKGACNHAEHRTEKDNSHA